MARRLLKRSCHTLSKTQSYSTLSQILQQFLHTKSRSSQLGAVDPLVHGAQESAKGNRVLNYQKDRDRADRDSTSRLRYPCFP